MDQNTINMCENSKFNNEKLQQHFDVEALDPSTYALHYYQPQLFSTPFHCGLYCRAVYNAERLIFHSAYAWPMMQHRPNPMELRSMDSYIQILCRFKKVSEKFLDRPPSVLKNHPLPLQRKKKNHSCRNTPKKKFYSKT